MQRSLMVSALAATLLAPLASQAADTTALSWVILKEGEPIGRETTVLSRDGDHTRVEVTTDSKVKVLVINFHYHHKRSEDWVGGRLERLIADTDDDGAIHHIDAKRDGETITATIDGDTKTWPAGTLPLTLWGKAILDAKLLTSIVDGEPYQVTVRDLGAENLSLNGQAKPAEHWRITGDIERDLWYGADGLLLKAAFRRRGYPIELVRE
jgi:hypothetical protein